MRKEGNDLILPKILTEEDLEIISQLCDIDRNKIDYSNKLKNGLSISNHSFNVFPIELLFADFQYEIHFINCKFSCLECYCTHKTNDGSFVFENCEFERFCLQNDCQFCSSFKINNKLIFLNCKFNSCIHIEKAIANNKIAFSGCVFNDTFSCDFKKCLSDIEITDCIFYKRVFMSGCFEKDIYFNDSTFCDYADFHECEFEKAACFYGVKFNKAPNFSACDFKKPKAVNLVNIDIDKLDFKLIERYIKDNYKDESYANEITNKQQKNEKEIIGIEHKYKLKCSKDLKDSFRVIKDILITQNNGLEAQEWHKLELYVKEKELEIRLGTGEKKQQTEYNPEDYKKFNFSRLRYIFKQIVSLFVGFLLLFCFMLRLLFLVPFNILKSVLKYVSYFCQSLRPLDFDKFLIFWKIKTKRIVRKISVMGRKMIDFTTWFDCVLLQIYRNTSNHHTNFVKILNFTVGMISLYGVILLLFLGIIDYLLLIEQIFIVFFIFLIVIILMLIAILYSWEKPVTLYATVLFFAFYAIYLLGLISFLSPQVIPTLYFMLYFLSIVIFIYYLFAN